MEGRADDDVGILIHLGTDAVRRLVQLEQRQIVAAGDVDQDANIIVGSTLDPEMVGKMRVSVVATGIDAAEAAEAPMPRR
ncbi:MAG: hypothetical protein AAFV96_13715, partial [Pseudomonadota bacterium]